MRDCRGDPVPDAGAVTAPRAGAGPAPANGTAPGAGGSGEERGPPAPVAPAAQAKAGAADEAPPQNTGGAAARCVAAPAGTPPGAETSPAGAPADPQWAAPPGAEIQDPDIKEPEIGDPVPAAPPGLRPPLVPAAAASLAQELLAPGDRPQRQVDKLLAITAALMERNAVLEAGAGAARAALHRAAVLEAELAGRSRELARALELLSFGNASLDEARRGRIEAEANLGHAIETVQDGFALFDAGERLVMCNSRFGLLMPGIRPSLRPGTGFADYVALVAAAPELALPEGTSREAWAVQRLARHHEGHVRFTLPLCEDRWLQISEQRTGDGGTVVLQADVTELVRLERSERLRLMDRHERMIRATLDHISQGVAIFDAGARLAGWNARLAALLAPVAGGLHEGTGFARLLERLGASHRPAAGLSAPALLGWAAAPAPRADISGELHGAAGQVLELFGQQMPEGGFVLSLTDISRERGALRALTEARAALEARVAERTLDLRDALARAERANAARSRFVAAASHDLLQPLAAARLLLASAQSGAPEAAPATLEKAGGALESAQSILGALLDISRLETGPGEVEMQPVSLGPLLAQLMAEFAPAARARGIGLHLRGPAQAVAVAVESDPTWLRRILQNLIGNALRYTCAGRVLVAVRRRGGGVRVEVHDTGPGIPAEAHAEIFREFRRLNSRASAAEGMGLGLAIVQRACALLGHELGLRSAPGRGSCFAVSLREAPGAALIAGGPAPLVLMIGAGAGWPAAAVRQIEAGGAALIEAASPPEALALLDELGVLPDLVLIAQHAQVEEDPPSPPVDSAFSAAIPAAGSPGRFAGAPVRVLPPDPAGLGALLAELRGAAGAQSGTGRG